MVIWRFDWENKKLWFLIMTSSINGLLRVPKNNFPGLFPSKYPKCPILYFLWHLTVIRQYINAFFFTELYRKIRKLTEGQKLCPGLTWKIMVGILRFYSLITQRGVDEHTIRFLLSIGWWITWYSQKHLYLFYCHNV